MGMVSGIVFGLIAMFFFGIATVIQTKLINEIGVFPALFYSYTFETLFLLLFFLKNPISPMPALILIVIMGLIGAAGVAFYYKALKEGDVSISSVVAKTFVIITIALSFFFHHEKLSMLQYGAIFVAFVGTFIISYKSDRRKKIAPGIPFALLAALSWGVFFFLYKFVITSLNPNAATFFTEATIWIVFLIAAFYFKPKITRKGALYASAAGLTVAAAALSLNYGYAIAPVSLITPIRAADPIITVTAARIFLKERLKAYQLGGIAITLIGIIILSL